MFLTIVACVAITSGGSIDVLFCGNSHTFTNDVPGMTRNLVTAGSGRRIEIGSYSGAFLQDIAQNPIVRKEISSGRWDAVVLQGAGLSSSHNYVHPMDGAIALAKAAKSAKARALLFAEWPRRSWDETEYILGIYRQIAKASGAEIVPICKVWDAVLDVQPKLELWQADGNHATQTGSYIAACRIAKSLGESQPRVPWFPSSLDRATAQLIWSTSQRT